MTDSLYWAERAMSPRREYEPVAKDGTVFGYVCCRPEEVEKVCKKRLLDHLEQSNKKRKHPIWC